MELISSSVHRIFYNIYALVIRKMNPMHPYYPFYISTNIAFFVMPVIMEVVTTYRFGTEKEYMEYVQSCRQTRYSWAGLIVYHT